MSCRSGTVGARFNINMHVRHAWRSWEGKETRRLLLCIKMLFGSSFLTFLLFHSLASAANIRRGPTCKVTPSSPHWPSQADWAALNASVSGRLIAPKPLGGVCHQNRPEYNAASCATVAAAWTSEAIHRSDPTSVMYNDNTCFPNNTAPCYPSGYPAYVIAATNAQDIQAGVKFAAKTGVRLIVKGTGHDYPAR